MNEPTANILDLPGLEPDNLLAFLALLGALRAMEAAQPAWQPRVAWDGPPWQARLHIAKSVTQEDVTAAVVDGMRRLTAAYEFGGNDNIKWTVQQFRERAIQLLATKRHDAFALHGTLASDGVERKNGTNKNGDVAATAICLLSGQGHQDFLGQLAEIPKLVGGPAVERDIEEAMFKPWQYVQRADGLKLRWDPTEDRRYAYRYTDPSKDAIGTVQGANLLAALGFPFFVVAPRHEELRTLAFERSQRTRERYVTWPIWEVLLSLAGIRALLGLPALGEETPARDKIEPYGVAEVMRATRLQNDKYFNFSRARPMWGSRASRAPAGAARAAG